MTSLLPRADALAAAGDVSAARALYARAARQRVPGAHDRLCHATAVMGMGEDALACCKEALAASPSNSFLHALDGQEALALGRFERAAESYERAAAFAPAAGADLLTNLGIALLAASRPSAAVKRLRAAVALAPRTAAAYTELARALEAAGSTAAACDARARVVMIDPASASHRLDL